MKGSNDNIICLKNNFKIFNKLCDRAKEIAFVLINIDKEGICYLDLLDFEDEIINLSPIEQIMYITFEFFNFLKNDIHISFSEQQKINVFNKQYNVDFLIQTYIDYKLDSPTEFTLKRPLIIECDGFDYHSKKDQMNYDYERETNLKLGGYDIIRFTGSQIYKEPLGCIYKIVEYIKSADVED